LLVSFSTHSWQLSNAALTAAFMCRQYRKQLGKDMKLNQLVALACMAVELAKHNGLVVQTQW